MPTSIHQNSSDFDTIFANANLSPAQAQVIAALAQGRTITAAAIEAGLHRSTIHNWLRDEPDFKTAMQQACAEYAAILNDGMRDLAARALETVRNLLDDPETPPAIRLKAALAVLDRPHFPNPGWQLPQPIEPPHEQAKEPDVRPMRVADKMEAKQLPQVARNAPCPCGSKQKYKRCCGSASPGKWTPPATAAA
jgi:hypothetical protein